MLTYVADEIVAPTNKHPAIRRRREPRRDEVVDGQVIGDRGLESTRVDVGLKQSHYTSPLPSPDDLDRYAAHVPDAAERLLSIGEREQTYRHEVGCRRVSLDEAAMPQFYGGQRRAHLIGLALGLVYLAVMLVAIVRGYSLLGAGGAAFGIAAVVWALRRDPAGANEQREPRARDSDDG